MKLKFKLQKYQIEAVDAVVGCFKGQPLSGGVQYRIDPGKVQQTRTETTGTGFKNEDILLAEQHLLENVQEAQRRQNLPVSPKLVQSSISRLNLDIEMETGTGKTYVYTKTIFELNRRFGWTKFIIVVPSIAIREGIYKSLTITCDHFNEHYHKKIRFFIYNSKQLHNLEGYSSDAGINVMIINVQAFNASGKDNRRIYEELDDFQTRRPIDVIAANRPILIVDEPQKIEGDSAKSSKSFDALGNFKPLFILRYSATHKRFHNLVHRLDALDAYNQKLVKKIAVRGITVKGLSGTNAYLFLEGIIISKQAPEARLEFEVKQGSGIKRSIRKCKKGDNLFDLSNGLDQYKGFVITDINAITDVVSFSNGLELGVGEASGDVNEVSLRRIQIREAIRAHLEKEQMLFHQGIKVLTLFFIDEVAKYRRYSDQGEERGEYARIFEDEYVEALNDLPLLAVPDYKRYLDAIEPSRTHNGYFSIDKKTSRLVDPTTGSRSTEADDVDAYDLILKDKERLLSFEEPTRFIFSHSALREGWDNPNVFVICTLKHSDNTISRRQEVGRGLRIAVDKFGERQDDPATVHTTNVLTVIASESYKDFVAGLQKDIIESLSERPRKADIDFFVGKCIATAAGPIVISTDVAKQIYRYLVKHEYTTDTDEISDTYVEAAKTGTLAPLPAGLQEYAQQIHKLVEMVYSAGKLPDVADDRKTKANPLNTNFHKQEFIELWGSINKKAVYSVHFESPELVDKCISALDRELRVTPMRYVVERGEQHDSLAYEQIQAGTAFVVKEHRSELEKHSVHSAVKYDLIGKLCEGTKLTRHTVASVLKGIEPTVFKQFRSNPEHFIAETVRLINEQKATMIIEHLSYDMLSDSYDTTIFTDNQTKYDFSKAGERLKRHIYDYVITDSKIERSFVEKLDAATEVEVYAKLPRGFSIPTPVGDYNPDWAIAFKEGVVKHIYFVAETKGSMSSMDMRQIELTKVECARRFFTKINERVASKKVRYDVVKDYEKLMDIVGA